MRPLRVIGNISRDHTRYPNHRGGRQLGGAALLLSRAAARAGRPATPVSVIGTDLAQIPHLPELAALDWSALRQEDGPSAAFVIDYDDHGQLTDLTAHYGVAEHLTHHALDDIARHPDSTYHLCCRRPLDVPALLTALTTGDTDFSIDFFLPSAPEMIQAARPWLSRAATVFVNAAEHQLLTQVASPADLKEIVVTDGPGTARILHHGLQTATSRPPVTADGEVTGAGDTFAGTFLALQAQGAAPRTALAGATLAAADQLSAPPLPIPGPRHP
ncbi:PfkB family carbohydrate kinase [Streptomyces syringium]|uniref:Sugar/nucleoside kinase (Ribokinase family) n=1 Tax=Streptomyces syringium TaxID=76729 RepID=A0ABS4XWL4_9ACTN|nr:PfkB family carbohydrate kinase [Streptomyces syringium]MBP2400730.1 sugar/nucleoside kinase (ribokinase family) [Streptomyces syringium]